MSRESLPADLVARSLAANALLAKTVAPMLVKAAFVSKRFLTTLEDGAARHPKAESDIIPALIRVKVHQHIQGARESAAKVMQTSVEARNVRNGAVCLFSGGHECRLYKAHGRYKTPATGRYQMAMMNQDHYWAWRANPGLFPDMMPPLLNGVMHYDLVDLDLVEFRVGIPDGFDGKLVRIVETQKVELPPYYDREDEGYFGGAIAAVPSEHETLILSDADVQQENLFDPFEGAQDPDAEPKGPASGEGSVLDPKKTSEHD